MIENLKVIVVMPGYNVEKTIEKTIENVPNGIVDEFIFVDDGSTDETFNTAKKLGLFCVRHERNSGYGAGQKTLYRLALERNADIVIMLHPDFQYEPRLVPAMAWMLASEKYDIILASRVLCGGALKGGMPVYKYLSNRFLSFLQNILLGQHISEYHTGFRGYKRNVLENLDFSSFSDDFVFDNQFLSQAILKKFRIGEISCPTKYGEMFSSMSFGRGIVYGLGVLRSIIATSLKRIGRA